MTARPQRKRDDFAKKLKESMKELVEQFENKGDLKEFGVIGRNQYSSDNRELIEGRK